MNDQNWYAIVTMLSIVITLYALKEGHISYLPDLFGLALALVAPRQSMAIGAVIILATIRHTSLAYGLVDWVPDWLAPVILPGARYMSISDADAERLEEAYKKRLLETKTDAGNAETPQPVAEKSQQQIVAATTAIMARAVMAGTLTQTEATRLAAQAQSGRRYQVWSRRIKAEIARQENHYRELDERHQTVLPKVD